MGDGLIRRAPSGALGKLWDIAAERHGATPIVLDRAPDIDPDRSTELDYASWAEFIHETSGWLHAAGVGPTDRVCLMKGNHADVLVLAAAAARIGAVPAQLAWTHPPETAKLLLERLERPVLVIDRARLESCELDEDALRRLTSRTIVVDGDEDSDLMVGLRHLRGAPVPPAAPRGDDEPMVIAHTSGTTGMPKLVIHSATTIRKLSLVETQRIPMFGLRREDVIGFCDPYFHARILSGAAAVSAIGPRLVMLSDPDPERTAEMLARHKPTIVETVPNAYIRWEEIADDPRAPFANVRLFVNTFDAIHVRSVRAMLRASKRRFPLWIQGWGQSESGPVTIGVYSRRSVRPSRRDRVTQNVGRAVPFVTKVRAIDPDTGNPLPRGTEGLLEVRSKDTCLDYVGESDRWQAKRRKTWWNMGDLGSVSRTGAVRLVDREVDRIPGASAIELEDELLESLPQLSEVIVLAADEGPPVPVVSLAGESELDAAAWERATASLPALAPPRVIEWEKFPRTATWKVKRLTLRERILPGTQPAGAGRWT